MTHLPAAVDTRFEHNAVNEALPLSISLIIIVGSINLLSKGEVLFLDVVSQLRFSVCIVWVRWGTETVQQEGKRMDQECRPMK